jgi:tetratricopeptide (TPR) repeat protein
MDRMDEAVAEVKRARETDPISAIINTDVAEMLYWARRYDDAMQQARVTIEMEPNFAHAHRVLERIYDEKHMYPEAIAEGERAVALSGEDMWMLLDLATTYALAGHMGDMRDTLKRVSKVSPGGVLPATGTSSELYAVLGDFDRAFEVMESQFRRREGGLILLNADPRFDVLKSDFRFQQLLQRVGLPQVTR